MPGAFGGRCAATTKDRRQQQQKKPSGRRVLLFRRGQLSIYPLLPLLSPFDRVVFGSQELEGSCVLEGSVACLQNVSLIYCSVTRTKTFGKKTDCFEPALLLGVGSVSVHSSCYLDSVTVITSAKNCLVFFFPNITKTLEDSAFLLREDKT